MVMAVDVSANPAFQAGVPKALFPVPPSSTIWDSAPDGQRFLFAVPVNDRTQGSVHAGAELAGEIEKMTQKVN
jgi:hypothetical protein